jgi:hypothetical protein
MLLGCLLHTLSQILCTRPYRIEATGPDYFPEQNGTNQIVSVDYFGIGFAFDYI